MTRSTLSPNGPENAKKQFRADAKARGLTFREAAAARNLLPKTKPVVAPGMGRRTHGEMTETYWDGQAWTEVIDHIEDTDWWNNEWECEVCYEEYERPPVQDDTGREVTVEKPVLVSLMDIAKPAKPKGVAREFEVVNGLSKVIACEEDVWHDNTGPGSSLDDFWEDWDNVYEDCAMEDMEKPSYSSVARLRNSG